MLQIAVITADFDDMPFSDQSAARSDWCEIRCQISCVLGPFKAFNIEDLETVSVAFNSKSDTNLGLKAQITVNASLKDVKNTLCLNNTTRKDRNFPGSRISLIERSRKNKLQTYC